jgi:hypothetical protein
MLQAFDSSRCVLIATQVPSSCITSKRYFGKCLQRETGYLKVTVKKRRQTNRRLTIDNLNYVHL